MADVIQIELDKIIKLRGPHSVTNNNFSHISVLNLYVKSKHIWYYVTVICLRLRTKFQNYLNVI